ncbi:protein phosphatase CheZ [Methylovorus mays]|jgi:chemotaxis protein CheZ|uniref:protein phosphatase CheZ n=1 Tax=Methylovorus mays TaxID=184077 RepID=UPI001E6297F6|nr:protein phosphatase CheZ [Methylovorus mays]MCB5207435.1 protein phosphatase CheZ [Methylovorus mays]
MSEPLTSEDNSSSAAPVNTNDEILNRIGHVTRALHDNLSGLGFDKILEKAASEIPDARERLNYVAKMTEQAAERVLNATDVATPLQNALSTQAADLQKRWDALLATPALKSQYDAIATDTMAFLDQTVKNTSETKDLLMEIMMAQDFQDLTGQVIKKITTLAQDLEQQLVQVLIDFSPGHINVPKKEADTGLLNGPQIDPNAVDVVASQAQVDDLLDSLGF